jgi:hypothetical protein
MYIGHYAIALSAKKIAPKVSLGTLFLAAATIDLIMSVLMLAGVEHLRISPGFTLMVPLDLYDYPISHSLAMSVLWSAVFAAIFYFIKRSMRGSLVLGLVVFSHWILDFITHTTDLALFPGSSIKVGLGIWNNVIASVLVEGLLFAIGIFIYVRSTKAKDKTGIITFWVLTALLFLTWISSLFGSHPPNAMTIAIVNQFQWIIIALAYWINRHRTGFTH